MGGETKNPSELNVSLGEHITNSLFFIVKYPFVPIIVISSIDGEAYELSIDAVTPSSYCKVK